MRDSRALRQFFLAFILLLGLVCGVSRASAFNEPGTEVYPFAGEPPETLRALFAGDAWAGYTVVSGSYATRFHGLSCAQAMLEKEGRLLVCTFTHDGQDWVLDAFAEHAVLEGRTPILAAEPEYGENFDIVYDDGTGAVETFSFFRGSDTWRLMRYSRATHGVDELVIHADARTLNVDGVYCFNAHSIILSEFDADAFPRTLEQAVREGEATPEAQSNIGLIQTIGDTPGIAYVPLYDAPSTSAAEAMRYFSGVEAEVLRETEGFAHVRIGNVEGYIRRAHIALGSEKAAIYPWRGDTGLSRAQMPESTVPLRDAPHREAGVLAQVETKRYLKVLGITADGQWLQVDVPETYSLFTHTFQTPEGTSGAIGFLAIHEVTQTDNMHSALVENPDPRDRLHLRTAPEKDAESLGKYYNGVEVEFLFGTENEDSWRQVIIEGAVGYVNASFLNYASDAGYAYLPPVAVVAGTKGGLNLRATPNGDAESFGLYENGAAVEVMAVCGEYAHVRTQEGLCGYMALKYLGGEPAQAASAKFKVLWDTPAYRESSFESQSDYTFSAGEAAAIYRRPVARWVRPYDPATDAYSPLRLEENTAWIFANAGEKWGYIPLECLESLWKPEN